MPAIRPGAPGEAARHVRDGIEVKIVEHHGDVVLGQDDILLDEIRPQRVGVGLGDQRVFGKVSARAAVGDHEGPRRLGKRGENGGEQQEGNGTR